MNALTPIVASFTSSGHAGTVIDTRVYDNGGRMTSSTYNNAGAAIGNLTYGWDSNHNKTSEAISGTMSNYGFTIPAGGYDAEDRLVSFTRTAGLTQAWNLSPVGDWNSVTTNGNSQTRTHGAAHELLTGAGQNVSTDVKGNITLIPSSLRPTASSLLLNWDFDNRLSTADLGNNGSIDVTYRFDALGRRVYRQSSSGTTVYVQSGQQTIADYVAGTAPASPIYRYVYASYIDEPVMRFKPVGSERTYYHRNQQYSIVALTGNTGAIQERYAYSAYGTPTITDSAGALRAASAVDNRITYTGREWDAGLVLYHYRARLYDPTLGRFCSRDPIGYSPAEYNRYGYVRSGPLTLMDPSGNLTALPLNGPMGVCGGAANSRVQYRLDDPNPPAGWLVQKVIACRVSGACPSPCNKPPCYPGKDECKATFDYSKDCVTYYEVLFGGGVGQPSIVDNFGAAIPDETCGKIIQLGEVRFYADAMTGPLNPRSKPIKLPFPDGTTIDSGISPATKNPFPFWKDPPTERPVFHSWGISWNCCCDNNSVNLKRGFGQDRPTAKSVIQEM